MIALRENGVSLHQNVNKAIHEMIVAIGAALHHVIEFKETENHFFYCNRETDTWCKYWKDKLNNDNQLVEEPGTPNHIVKPLFLEESKDTLLKKCLHDKTQNVKEALNNLISTKRPNNVYVAREVLEM